MKVITFSTIFPSTHPRKGVKTFFPEQILCSLGIGINDVQAFKSYMNYFAMLADKKKVHTIRAGNRWKVGDWFSPRIWTGKPYASKQLQFGPPIQIKKIWNFECNFWNTSSVVFVNGKSITSRQFIELARNDGLNVVEMMQWFQCHPKKKSDNFVGQILCWDESVEY